MRIKKPQFGTLLLFSVVFMLLLCGPLAKFTEHSSRPIPISPQFSKTDAVKVRLADKRGDGVIRSGSPNHYFHYVMDFLLPVLHFFHSHQNFAPIMKLNTANQSLGNFRQPFEELMGVECKEVGLEEYQLASLYEVELISLAYTIPKDYTLLLRNHAYQRFAIRSQKGEKVVLITRGSQKGSLALNGSKRRWIENSDNLARNLSKIYGDKFEEVTLEDMTQSKQVALFSRTRCLIAQHGAALTNMIFMPKKSSIIELGAVGFHGFKNLAENTGNPHVYLPMKRVSMSKPASSKGVTKNKKKNFKKEPRNGGFEADIPAVVNALGRIRC